MIDVAAGAIRDPVHHAGQIADEAAGNVAEHLDADIAVRDERGRERALEEQEIRGRLQPLEPERRLAFAHAKAKGRREHRVDVRVLQHQRSAGEVGIQVELEALREAAAQVRPQPADDKRVVHDLRLVAGREAAIGVQRARRSAA